MLSRNIRTTLIGGAIRLFEQSPVPDAVTRVAVRGLVARTSRSLVNADSGATAAFARVMNNFPIALHADAANAQHYEVPAEFFTLVLGPQRKYSCCYYETPDSTLAEAEDAALSETARRAGLADGQAILELGCGWGSLSIWMAQNFPTSEITAVSNSGSQRTYIESRAADLGLTNLQIVTADVNTFRPSSFFDRIVSVEMFEHMSNWAELLMRVRTRLAPAGRVFLHVFTHPTIPYRFDETDPADWIGQHFFTGGIMPSHGLIREFSESFVVERDWRWSGIHYERTANDWLANFDRYSDEIMRLFKLAYGRDAQVWHRRWRLFFIATAVMFGHDGGAEWGVSHYLLRPAR